MAKVTQRGLREVRSFRKGVDSGKILSLPDDGGGAEGAEKGMACPEGSGFGEILSLPDGEGGVHG